LASGRRRQSERLEVMWCQAPPLLVETQKQNDKRNVCLKNLLGGALLRLKPSRITRLDSFHCAPRRVEFIHLHGFAVLIWAPVREKSTAQGGTFLRKPLSRHPKTPQVLSRAYISIRVLGNTLLVYLTTHVPRHFR